MSGERGEFLSWEEEDGCNIGFQGIKGEKGNFEGNAGFLSFGRARRVAGSAAR